MLFASGNTSVLSFSFTPAKTLKFTLSIDRFSMTETRKKCIHVFLLNYTRRASARHQAAFYRQLASIVIPAVFMKIRRIQTGGRKEISASVRALRSLRDGVRNFVLFEQEVKDTLNSIFEKHQTERNVFAQVRLSRMQLGPVIEEEITIWLKSMQRRLRGRMRARDPWTIVFTRDIPQRFFKVSWKLYELQYLHSVCLAQKPG